VIETFGDATGAGEWACVRLTVDGERIVAADAEGLERPLVGLTLLDAARVGGDPLSVEALAAALGPVFRASADPGRVVVAMSGGVDSAVALLRAGPAAVGVTLRLWQDPAAPDASRACCSPDAVASARRTCHELGVPHVTLDLREEFVASVVDPFVNGYLAGETPNPCTRCNGSFRFDALVAFADRAGADRVWTGHYARLVDRDGQRFVARARDRAKDQSYMLAHVDSSLLSRVEFPLGAQTKAETRAEAARAGLAVAARPESQEACFLGGDDYRAFLARRGARAEPGAVIDHEGSVLGEHAGYWRFTTGQRRGLQLASARPLYVVGTDAATNTVVVGPREATAITRVAADGRLEDSIERGDVKLRYRSPAVPGTLERTEDGFVAVLDRPAYGVARGQLAVVYDRDVVVGAGTVTEAA
jgi:tRNA-specific 2-thiouridylase